MKRIAKTVLAALGAAGALGAVSAPALAQACSVQYQEYGHLRILRAEADSALSGSYRLRIRNETGRGGADIITDGEFSRASGYGPRMLTNAVLNRDQVMREALRAGDRADPDYGRYQPDPYATDPVNARLEVYDGAGRLACVARLGRPGNLRISDPAPLQPQANQYSSRADAARAALDHLQPGTPAYEAWSRRARRY